MIELQVRLASSPLLVLAFALSCGILAGHFISSQSALVLATSSGAGAGLTLLSSWSLFKGRISLAIGCVIGAFFAAGLTLSMIDGRSIKPNRIARLYADGLIAPGEPVEVTGTIEGQPEPAPDSFYLTVRAERIRIKGLEREANGTVLLLAHVSDQRTAEAYHGLELRHGARVRVMTALNRDESFRNPGVSPFTEYLEREGYDATGVIKSSFLVERLDDARVFLPLAWVYEWREYLQKEFAARFSRETAGVLAASLLGNRYQISHAAAERFRAGGTFHVLVISGLQIAFIGGLVFLIARAFTRRKLLQFVFAAIFMWAYAIGVGSEPSVARAALMFTVVAFAPLVSRRANSFNSLGGAALVLLVLKPTDLFNPSFQLTFLCVLAIISVAVPLLRKMQEVGAWRPTRETPYPPECPRWFRVVSEALFWSEREWRSEIAASSINYRLFKTSVAARIERWHVQRPLRFAVAAIIISAGVQIGLLPLQVIYFHRLSIASLWLNIFVGVLMAGLALVALAALLISYLSSWLASPLIVLAEVINWAMIHSVDPFSRLGITSVRLPHYTGWPSGVYALYYLLLVFLVFALARWNPLRPVSITKIKSRLFFSRKFQIAALAFVATFALIVLHPLSRARADGKLHVDFLDVGQGDCALLTMPDGTTLLVDGGGRPNMNRADRGEGEEPFERDKRSVGERVVSEYLWSRGLDRIDYILATHADADHIDGLNDVARNFKVRGAIVARTPVNDPGYARFAATMNAMDVPVHKVGAGDVLKFGNSTAQVLWPPPGTNVNAPSRNNDSVILLLRYGERSLLLTGDIEKEGEAALLQGGIDLHGDIVKVGHHGSKTSSTAGFVSATHPSLAIISVGRNSMFGHPHKDVVERWRASGAEALTTGQRGTISVTTDGHALSINTFVK